MLVETDDNPIPKDIRVGQLKASNNTHIRYALLRARTAPHKGTIICLHGRNECIEKYIETSNDLADQGFHVVTFDWRGQGASSRFIKNSAKGYIRDFKQSRDDLDRILQEIVLPECNGPYFVLAHSTGGLVTLTAAHALMGRISRIVLLAPFLGMSNVPLSTEAAGIVATLLKWIGLGRVYMAGGPRPREAKPFDQNVLTSDPKRYARNMSLFTKAPHLFLGGPTAAWVSAATKAMRQVRRESYLAKLHLPILIITAGRDQIVDNEVTKEVSDMIPACKLLQIDGASHELLQEKDYYREQVMAAIMAFFPGEDTIVPQKTALD